MNKSVVLAFVLSLVFSSSIFANTIKGKEGDKCAKAIKKAPAVSIVEQDFLNELDNYYKQTFEIPASETSEGIEETETQNVIVYNLAGQVITTKKSEIPVKADLLMQEGNITYYIVY